GYFAGRCAPLGQVDAPPAVAALFSFAPARVEQAMPEVWTPASPERALAARAERAAAALARLLAPVRREPVERATDALEQAAAPLDCGCGVRGAANAPLHRPTGPFEPLL
ncbi:hypothetical protein VM98_36930, partial [Streptomyces rubellomurinus subsp. indigoferus]